MWMSLNTPGQLSEAMDNEESPGRVERLKMEVAELKMFRFSSFVTKMGKD